MIIPLDDLSVAANTSVLDVLRIIDEGGAQIALVVDAGNRLLGTLTDGDIRRGLLNGASLKTRVDRLMNQEFRFVYDYNDKSDALMMMRHELVRQVPVLDKEGRVVDLLLLQNLLNPPHHSGVIVIMAGGKGSRLRPYTEHCPKPMLPVGNQPILEILLEQCIACGFDRFYISVNYLKEQIIDYFGDGSRWGVSIDYLVETKALGTAGSLQLLPDSVGSPFIVLNGDVLTHLDLSELLDFHQEHNAQATLCVRQHELSIPYGVVTTSGVELASFEEKPTYRHLVNAGVYVIDPKLLSLLPRDEFTDMPGLLQDAQKAGQKIAVCPIHEYWIDIGRPESLKYARQHWGKKYEMSLETHTRPTDSD